MSQNEQKVSFKDTLNLPRTDFPIRPNPKEDDEAQLIRWDNEKIYAKTFVHNHGKKKFILHDGPPYANGHLHLGHAYNKILKDIVTKSQRMMGKQVPVTPGWDCHGLPIELKVSQENPGLAPAALKKKCRAYAQQWIDVQRNEFKQLGVFMDWDNPYTTMSYNYEASILHAFGIFVDHGYIERKNKTVPWCASCQTVLASAEIEYQERKDPSIYVLFSLEHDIAQKIAPALKDKQLNLVVWTTTPWTLPLNRAVLLKPATSYAIAQVNDHYIIIGQALIESLQQVMGTQLNILGTVQSDTLAGMLVHHPLIQSLQVPIILDNSVSLQDGTACVHCAPGCGPEDYEVGIRNNLEIYSPISVDGRYTKEIQPEALVNMPVTDGQGWVIKQLLENNRLLFKASIKHSYPHCWRCHQGLIFRATKQWFCDLEKGELKEKTLVAIDSIKTLPEKSSNRLKATIEGRLEWCLSRQRIWGVPIPALICLTCDEPYITQEFVDTIAREVAKHGVEYWDKITSKELSGKVGSCVYCQGTAFRKETDILDVWFDSGISHYAVLKKNPELDFPADMYLEGKDQHRGWFQSSLLTSMVIEQQACMKTIVTHGFTVDEQGRKMSKSLGNVVAPQEIIDKLGTDGLRLWVASIDCSSEAVVSDKLMQNVQEVYRKIRNTSRFLLSNLYDFNYETDALPLTKLTLFDQYALEELFKLNHAVLKSYADFDFTAIFHQLSDYCSVELSAFYLDIIKDRLYTEKGDGHLRRSAQTTCWYILDTLTKLMAPILSFTAEQISSHYQKNKRSSIHLQDFNLLPDIWELIGRYQSQERRSLLPQLYAGDIEPLLMVDSTLFATQHSEQWDILKEIRSALLKALEEKRAQGLIKHSLEARIRIYIDTHNPKFAILIDFFKELAQSGSLREDFFKEFLIVSQVEILQQPDGLGATELPGLVATVDHAQGNKCPRCWQWDVTKHEHHLCNRCQKILGL